MKSLTSKIRVLAFLCSLSYPNIQAQEIKPDKDSQDFLKVGLGFQTWDKIKPYRNFSYLNIGFEKTLTKNANLEGGFDYGSQKEKIDDKEYGLTRLSVEIGLKKFFLISDDKKFLFYINGGTNYILISEKQKQIENEDPILGFYYGGGIENPLNSNTIMFLETGINKAEIKTDPNKLDISGPKLDFGIKINPSEFNKRKVYEN